MESQVILGDAIQVARTFQSNSVDHIITDPPYNISSDAKQTMVGPNIVPAQFGLWDCMTKDQYDVWFTELMTELLRIAKPNANALIWLDKAYAGVAWFMAENIGWNPRNIIAAVKKNPSRRMRNNIKSAWESCLWLSKGPVKTLNKNHSTLWDQNVIYYNIGVDKKTDHPNEKYESMIEPLIEMYTNTGDIVLDTFCGSGSIAVTCKKKNRRYIAADYDLKWIDVTHKRLDSTSFPLLS